MILNISERTDIVAFYFDWFLNRLDAGYAYVRNPYDHTKVSKICLEKEIVDCIIFTTKNPLPLEQHQSRLDNFQIPYGISVTITPYTKEIEPHVPNKKQIIASFQRLSTKLGKEKMLLRYDPIFLNEKYTLTYHERAFEKLLSQLSGYTDTCILSFLDLYSFLDPSLQEPSFEEIMLLAEAFSKIAQTYGVTLQTCGEAIDLSEYGILKRGCMSCEYIEKVMGQAVRDLPPRKTRENCTCLASVDLGVYNTCLHGCSYCYATSKRSEVKKNYQSHKKDAPFLIGTSEEGDQITLRKTDSLKEIRIRLPL